MVNLISDRPYLGYMMTAVAPVSGLLTVLNVLTPLIGILGALFGAAAGFITMLIKWEEWKEKRAARKLLQKKTP